MYTYTNSKGNTYILHRKMRTLKSGKQSPLHYFAKEVKTGEGVEALNAVPEGYVVAEQKSGLPTLKKAA